jgi:hypothetical protein
MLERSSARITTARLEASDIDGQRGYDLIDGHVLFCIRSWYGCMALLFHILVSYAIESFRDTSVALDVCITIILYRYETRFDYACVSECPTRAHLRGAITTSHIKTLRKFLPCCVYIFLPMVLFTCTAGLGKSAGRQSPDRADTKHGTMD